MAYVLGFIYADGNLIHTKRGTWFWSLQITDKDILEEIKKALDSSHIVSKKKKHENQKQSYRFQVGSKNMCEDLIRLGLTERKSKTILLPTVPKKYFPDFLRGYFDGDGTAITCPRMFSTNRAGLRQVSQLLSSLNFKHTLQGLE